MSVRNMSGAATMDIWSIRHRKKECVMKYEFFLIEHSIDMLFLKKQFFLEKHNVTILVCIIFEVDGNHFIRCTCRLNFIRSDLY